MTILAQHVRFLLYVLQHKWLVFIEACKLGIPWRGLVHDLSKFSPQEWKPRVAALGQCAGNFQDELGYYVADRVPDELAASWLHHYHQNPHHWQWWVVMLDGKVSKVLPMTDQFRREMLADWLAVSRMPGRQAMIPWYEANRERILLHPDTRLWLEKQIAHLMRLKTTSTE